MPGARFAVLALAFAVLMLAACTAHRAPSMCRTGWTWDPNFPQGGGQPKGGCVPPATWPVATDCQAAPSAPPTCSKCSQPPWQNQQNCPRGIGGATTYMYGFMGAFYCCIDPPY